MSEILKDKIDILLEKLKEYELLYNGEFSRDKDLIRWIFRSDGQDYYEESDLRWDSYTDIKLAIETIVEEHGFQIFDVYGFDNEVGFYIRSI